MPQLWRSLFEEVNRADCNSSVALSAVISSACPALSAQMKGYMVDHATLQQLVTWTIEHTCSLQKLHTD